ncbi:methyltransferase [Nocardia brasiliensis]|uniref:methyltransferase n=1 Tax=Nocardia brasiliensis TaxID=37326 RepID=UPI002458C2C1|nr:methyltransferase [Nocardia brasiliensis]
MSLPELRDAAAIKQLANAFCHAKLLLTAHEVGVFDWLATNGPADADRIAAGTALHPRGVGDLLRGLTLLGLLVEDPAGYRNSPLVARTLVPGTPEYLGGFLRRADHMLYPTWGSLDAALRTGAPQAAGAGPDAFLRMLDDPKQRAQYLRMMDSASTPVAHRLAEVVDWSRYRTVADIGGCRGNLAGILLAHHPHLRATVFDLAPMGPELDAHLSAQGVADRASFVAGDFFADPLPAADVLILGHVLHNWSSAERAKLVDKAFQAVRPGGALLVYDAMYTGEPADLARVLVSLNMLLVTEGGSEYPVAEAVGWLTAAGCTGHTAVPLGGADTLVIGHKETRR